MVDRLVEFLHNEGHVSNQFVEDRISADILYCVLQYLVGFSEVGILAEDVRELGQRFDDRVNVLIFELLYSVVGMLRITLVVLEIVKNCLHRRSQSTRGHLESILRISIACSTCSLVTSCI